jgi:TusA-related sulfurtransferase
MSSFSIGADTRVAELLEALPEAEEILIRLAPQFKALRNPVLRRTVARVATLEQAAKVAGIPARELVLALRRELGVEGGDDISDTRDGGASEVPPWVELEAVPTIDGGALLDAGETPVAKASTALTGMAPGEVLVLSAPFQPAPLIDSLRAKGHDVYAREANDGTWLAWIRKAAS